MWSGGGPAAVAEFDRRAAPVVAIAPSATATGASPDGHQRRLLSRAFADIVERVSPAVVSLKAKVTAPRRNAEVIDEDLEDSSAQSARFLRTLPQERPGQPQHRPTRRGPGFGLRHRSDRLHRHQQPRRRQRDRHQSRISPTARNFKAKLIGRDELTDVALIKIDTEGKSLPAVTFADDSKVRVGDWVLAVGNPFGLGGTVTAGIVSARGRDDVGGTQYTDYLQIDASINRGNSGGPTFDLAGRVIGMNTAIFSPSGGSVGIGFAIPSSTIQRVVAELKKLGRGHARLARRADPEPERRRGRGARPAGRATARSSPKSSTAARPQRPASARATSCST